MLPETYPIDGSEGYPRTTPMRVIVCGFPRTGTMSTHAALQMLGFNRTHHMIHLVASAQDREIAEWTRALRSKYRQSGMFTRADWDRLLGDCQGCVDYPSALFAADLARLYPDARVVMLNRDPASWHASVAETVAAFRAAPGLLRRLQMLYCWLFAAPTREMARFRAEVCHAEGNYDHVAEREKAIAFMQRSYDECRAAVDEERRLEWRVQDGWAPLCAHLGVEVPMVRDEATGEMVTAPFPRINDRATFRRNMDASVQGMIGMANEVVFGFLGRSAVLGAVGYGAYAAWKMAAAARR